MNRKHVPAVSLALCVAFLGWLWSLAPQEELPAVAPVPLAVSAQSLRLPTRSIRVGVTSEPQKSLKLEVADAFRIRAVGSEKVLHSAKKLAATTVTATARGLRIGKQEFPASRLEIVTDKSPSIWVDGHQYRGSVRLFRQAGNQVLAVNVLPLEDYVASVVDSEMPASFPEAARQAQAIVARTYAVYQMQQAPGEAIVDLYASTRSQKYLGFQYRDGSRLLAGESAAGRRDAEATRGKVCTWRGKIFCTYYCAVCGGGTVKGTEVFSDAAPPLQSTRCDWCREARLYRWTAEISKRDAGAELEPLFRKAGKSSGAVRSVSLVKTPPGGLPEFDVRSDRQTIRISGAELRQALSGRGLYSPRFTVEDRGKTFVINGRGHGHGVGLCQWGARGLALEGKTCEQILQHYYAGSHVVRGK